MNNINDINSYVYTDGTNADYLNWYSGEPNNNQGLERCTYMMANENHWADTVCNLDPVYAPNNVVCAAKIDTRNNIFLFFSKCFLFFIKNFISIIIYYYFLKICFI